MSLFIKHKYTLFGVVAILLWSSLTALIRDVSELFGAIGGAAMLYTISSIFLVSVMGVPKINSFPKRYLVIGGLLFVSYEVCFALSLGMANDRHQSMEMAVINYLWPAITILLTVITGQRKVNVLVYPSVIIAFIGLAWCISGDSGISINILMSNIAENPLTYFLAFSAAMIWATYCTITKKMSDGKNPIALFFIATAITLWIKYAFSDESGFHFTFSTFATLLLSGVVMGSGYALWNRAVIGGNIMLLGTLSYFTPVFATLFSSVYLSVTLGASFWQGVALVTLGSIICFFVTREKTTSSNNVKSPVKTET
ncbi:aromatic amino acid DMT transporter YddG [Motilimonas sp. 1_MG-2023]|uniref:aromatic amino acid DMT transporter YddG n=1 Tax=Motilimonas sp. 1_MG-2023 TaxID=3062672 RepID=UPI0026E4170A|nr:aromatic amino acid DMT transporter YddG [Motilimonas sp. 1_MG-2023]MDO6527868.1 aromatic amino acid DMT transporter YddG [Motilimonas sp. 1_MG-2023]